MDGYGRRYERIAGELRAAILAGKHRPGARIESENELAARYQVSRQTVRKALAALIEQGYLRAEHGRGTFVTERSLPGSKPSPCSPPIWPTTSSPASFRASIRNWPSMDTASS